MGLFIGVMSGTSLDGVDVVLCNLEEATCKLLASIQHPLDTDLKTEILHLISHPVTLAQVGALHHRLGVLFAEAVTALIHTHHIDPKEVKAIGLHGQTLWHEPNSDTPFSMQLGDPNVVAVRTGIDVVADFRSKDIALGGQGAPFAPAFHHFLFHTLSQKTAVLNIGGMANITVIDSPLLGYDTGVGNVLLDLWINQHKQLPYDHNGNWAASGSKNSTLLARFFDDPFFGKTAPKSTGREHFNASWLKKRVHDLHVNPQDVQATLLELTAQSIANEVSKFDVTLLLICGGGVKNSFLMQRLRALLPKVTLHSTDHYGVNSEFMEALAFAWLAYKRVRHESVPLKDVTGALRDAVLGGIYAST
jgi:anhydro-N-acetylmuramic acid kinase